MAIKEHPFLVTTTLRGDGVTIKYDITKPNRSDAVGKAYTINADGKAELAGDGDPIDGKVNHVDDANNITAAYMFGGLRLPLGDGETVAKGDRLVGALGPSSAKGHVKSASAVTDLPTDFEDLDAAGINDDTKKLAAYNAARTQINSVSETVGDLVDAAKGKGSVVDFDSIHALVAFPG